ncbi:uncharacterized protein G2W53_029029 [Senna tora]|uniref:Uncharacterized protein n=1 Tax=Senna tora TaxID=362788 RepID=A0A834W9B2_9FABA|nr:uncharacterized protein G2W53_029029 [Senna tora]
MELKKEAYASPSLAAAVFIVDASPSLAAIVFIVDTSPSLAAAVFIVDAAVFIVDTTVFIVAAVSIAYRLHSCSSLFFTRRHRLHCRCRPRSSPYLCFQIFTMELDLDLSSVKERTRGGETAPRNRAREGRDKRGRGQVRDGVTSTTCRLLSPCPVTGTYVGFRHHKARSKITVPLI